MKKKRSGTKVPLIPPFCLSLAVVLFFSFSAYHKVSFLEILELKTIDLRFQARGNRPNSGHVALVVVDEKSLNAEGKWLWPRSKIAKILNKLSDLGAAVVALDIVFAEPDNKDLLHSIRAIKTVIADRQESSSRLLSLLDSLENEYDDDRILARSIKNSQAQVVLGIFLQMEKEQTGHLSQARQMLQLESSQSASYGVVRYTTQESLDVELPEAYAVTTNIPLLSSKTSYSGFFNNFPDQDGVIRSLPSVIRYHETLYAPLAIKALNAYYGQPPALTVDDYGIKNLIVGEGVQLPVDGQGNVFINYRGGEQTFPHISATDVLNDRIDSALIKDKIIILGATATGIFDVVSTPFDSVYPGPEVHASLIDMALQRDFLYKPQWFRGITLALIMVLGLGIGLIVSRLDALKGGVVVLSGIALYSFLCFFLFSSYGWVLNLTYPVLTLLLVYSSVTAYTFSAETRQKRFIKNAFSTYLSPAVVKQLVDKPNSLNLGGEERKITAFFSDVQSFTTVSECLSPAELVTLLNEYLTEMTDIILEHSGTVDKFEGDAIIAFFGAPTEIENQEEVACLVSIQMQKRLKVLRKKWKEEGKPELHMRIGVNTGMAVVGNMGSKNRMDYTMMGDTVNVAARLEGANKFYGTSNLVGEKTFLATRKTGTICGREIDTVQLVGKNKPLRVYELLCETGDISSAINTLIYSYEKGLLCYRDGAWLEAIGHFQNALDAVPEDNPSRIMLQRCKEFQKNPPEQWSGVYVLQAK